MYLKIKVFYYIINVFKNKSVLLYNLTTIYIGHFNMIFLKKL